jgi:hypothetical protein
MWATHAWATGGRPTPVALAIRAEACMYVPACRSPADARQRRRGRPPRRPQSFACPRPVSPSPTEPKRKTKGCRPGRRLGQKASKHAAFNGVAVACLARPTDGQVVFSLTPRLPSPKVMHALNPLPRSAPCRRPGGSPVLPVHPHATSLRSCPLLALSGSPATGGRPRDAPFALRADVLYDSLQPTKVPASILPFSVSAPTSYWWFYGGGRLACRVLFRSIGRRLLGECPDGGFGGRQIWTPHLRIPVARGPRTRTSLP